MNPLLYLIPFVLSMALFVVAAVYGLYWISKPRRLKRKKIFSVTRSTGKHLMYFSLMLLGVVWMLRFAVGNWCFDHPDPENEIRQMGAVIQLFNSFVHALQTFSMDESYNAYIDNGLKMALSVFHGHFRRIWMGYFSLVNLIAPVAGGAFIFEILAGIFPQLRYTVSCCAWYKKRFYFTALNESSVALAKSIVSDPEGKNAILVFTDVYADDENEESSELLLSAKALGAICLKDDLMHISLRKTRKKKAFIFLSDQEESENLQTLSQLLSLDRQKNLKNTEICVFGTDKKTSNIEDEVIYLHNRLNAEYGKDNHVIIPDLAPVNGIRNMAQRLFYQLPLFEGLYGKSGEDRQINLTIVGSGVIGTEVFLNAYWFGQMAGVKLNINVVSKQESEAEFVSRIDGINPDIMATSRVGDPKLNAYIKTDSGKKDAVPQERYFHFRYEQEDVLSCDLDTFLSKGIGDDSFNLRDTDYFVVAAGSDEDNFCIADKLRQAIGYYHLNEARQNKTIISYVIYNSEFCKTLNTRSRHKHVSDVDTDEFDIYMHAFGSMEEIYSIDNILRNDIRKQADGIDQKYTQQESNQILTISDQIKTRQYYNKRASDARSLQLRYKIYCADLLKPSLFCTRDDAQYTENLLEAERIFAGNVSSTWTYPEYAPKANALAWMEHRRWNAFMRMNGFKCPEDIDKYIQLNSDVHCLDPNADKPYQFLFIKRHPCIVECDLRAFPGVYCKDKRKKLYGESAVGPDELDVLCQKLGSDYKQYDYPETDIPQNNNESKGRKHPCICRLLSKLIKSHCQTN